MLQNDISSRHWEHYNPPLQHHLNFVDDEYGLLVLPGDSLHGAEAVFVSLQTSQFGSLGPSKKHCACQLACLCLVSC